MTRSSDYETVGNPFTMQIQASPSQYSWQGNHYIALANTPMHSRSWTPVTESVHLQENQRVDQAQASTDAKPHFREKFLTYVEAFSTSDEAESERNSAPSTSVPTTTHQPIPTAEIAEPVAWVTPVETADSDATFEAVREDAPHETLRIPFYALSRAAKKMLTDRPHASTLAEIDIPEQGSLRDDSMTTESDAQERRQARHNIVPHVDTGTVPVQQPGTIAAWEVPEFRWPDSISQIVNSSDPAIQQISLSPTKAALEMLRGTRHRLAIFSAGRRQGSTWMSMLMARQAAKMGQRVLLVDADISNPSLTRELGLTSRVSWHHEIYNQQPTTESLVFAQNSGVCLMPLAGAIVDGSEEFVLDKVAEMVNSVQKDFDLILIDAGPTSQLLTESSNATNFVDSGVLVRDIQQANHRIYEQIRQNLKKFGISKLVVAENFVRPRNIA